MAKRRPKTPPLSEEDRDAIDDYLEIAAAPWAGHLMRTATRRTWLAPLIAVPIAQLVESAIPPSLDPLDARQRNTGGKLSRGVMAALNRLTTDRTAPLTDDDARCIICLADFYVALPAELLSSKDTAAELLGIPTDLAGEVLVRQVARAIDDHLSSPAWLALLAAVLLGDFSNAKEPRDLLPAPDAFFAPVVQALDRRCHGLGFKNWGDALEHSSQVWTAAVWPRSSWSGWASGDVPRDGGI